MTIPQKFIDDVLTYVENRGLDQERACVVLADKAGVTYHFSHTTGATRWVSVAERNIPRDSGILANKDSAQRTLSEFEGMYHDQKNFTNIRILTATELSHSPQQ